MINKENLFDEVREVLEIDPRINLSRYPIKIELSGNNILLEGEVQNISIKRLITEKVSSISGDLSVIDHLHVEPMEWMNDSQILKFYCNSVIEEPFLKNCSVYLGNGAKREKIREALYINRGEILVSVNNGIISLENYVLNLLQKRLAGVLAWWTPGSRNVVNNLNISSLSEQGHHEISDSVRMILERDPILKADQILVSTKNSTVTLEGKVDTETQKQMAENDAWYISGVENVVNHLVIKA